MALSGCALATGAATAGEPATDASAATSGTPTTLQTIIVTGTRAFGRTAADSLSPIDVISPSDLAATSAPDLSTALRMLLPSFNFPQTTNDDASQATAPAQLRGLSPDETLVLIDGKRQHTTSIANITGSIGQGTSPVDLAAIPISAIARIEVLRDGAAAQYGSDAIAGVINIILKSSAQHGSISASRGVYSGWQGQTSQGGADGGVALGQRGFVHLSVDYLDQQPTNHAGPDGRFPGDPGFDQVTSHAGRARELQKQAAVNAQYQLSDAATLYGFALFSHRNVTGNGFFRSISQYTNPGSLTIFPYGFLPAEQYTMLDGTYVLGVRGLAAGWHYDVSADAGTSHSKSWDSNDLNFSLGAASPTAFYIGTTALQDSVFDVDLSRDFDLGWYAPLTVAWGVAYRHARFMIKPGDPASYAGSGAQAFAGYQPADAGSHSRTNVAEYLDLTTDFSARLSAEFAARHEHYSDFGNTTVWKLSARYAFSPVLALRGTASTGFRAPSLQQEYYSATSDQPDILPDGEEVFLVQRTFPVSDPAAKALGAQPLKPEKSHNYSIGLVLTPHGGPTVTLDAYQVTVDDRVVLSGSLAGSAVEAYLTSVGFPFLTGGRFFTNAVDTRTRGVDLVGDWDVPLATTHLHLTGGLNYNKTNIRSIAPNPPQLGLIGLSLPIITASKIGQLTVNSPRTKAFAAAVWDIGRFRLRGQLTRYGEFTQLDNDPADDQTYGARWLLDASVAYTAGAWTFTVGGNNVTNAYPERSNAANDFHGIDQYPSISPFGFDGAYWYANVAYHW